jgi:hypothetical protein
MTEEIQVWRMSPSLRGSVGVWKLRAVILQGKIQETITENPRRQKKKSNPIELLKKTIIKGKMTSRPWQVN